jgi:phosphoserine phosphatase
MGKRSVALFDLDKTIYNDHSFFGIVKFLADEGVINVSTWEEVSAELGKYKGKVQTYSETANKLLEIFARSLSGKSEVDVREATAKFFDNNRGNFYSYFEKILPKLKKTHEVWLVTTNIHIAAEVVVKMFELDGYISTQFEVVEGRFTGRILSTLANGKSVVEGLLTKYAGESLAFGDSENDIEMLSRVNTAVCVNPSAELRAEALKRDWVITTDGEAHMLECLDNG